MSMYNRLSCHFCASPSFSNTEMDYAVASKWPNENVSILKRPELLKQLRWAGRRSSRLARTALPFSIHAPPGSGTQNNYKIIMIMYLRKHLSSKHHNQESSFSCLTFSFAAKATQQLSGHWWKPGSFISCHSYIYHTFFLAAWRHQRRGKEKKETTNDFEV